MNFVCPAELAVARAALFQEFSTGASVTTRQVESTTGMSPDTLSRLGWLKRMPGSINTWMPAGDLEMDLQSNRVNSGSAPSAACSPLSPHTTAGARALAPAPLPADLLQEFGKATATVRILAEEITRLIDRVTVDQLRDRSVGPHLLAELQNVNGEVEAMSNRIFTRLLQWQTTL